MDSKPASRALLLSAALLLLLASSDAVAAPAPPTPAQIVLWSSQGPVAVDRSLPLRALGARRPEQEALLRQLLEGPTASERARGLLTAIPEGTHLAACLDQPGGTVIVRLQMSQEALSGLTHDAFEITVQQIGKTLLPLDWRDLRIQVRDPATGDFVALAEFLPEVFLPVKPSTTASPDPGAPTPPAEGGQPPAPGQAQPNGALSGKTVYVSAGHGWEWNSYKGQWRTQRPPYPSSGYAGPIIEDHNNAEAVNQYLLHYLWNAGARVWPVRERDLNDADVVVDDGGLGYSESGTWTGVSGGYGGDSRHADSVTGGPTATASWHASLPSDGRYAVYVWYESGGDRPADARYTVHHAGGDTTIWVDQRHHGYTWHYLGTYGFLASAGARVTLTNQSGAGGKTVVADAVRFGGGTFDSLSGIDTEAPWPPGRPWWEVASYYYTQRMGMAAGYGDVTVRPVYARWEHAGTGDDAVYVSWHSNGATGYAQWDYSGTETYAHNGEGLARTAGSLQLRNAIHTEVVHDIRAGWDASWVDRGEKLANLGELRLLWDENPSTRMPGALIEIGFHDHPGDTDALKEPRFNQLVARAVYQGIVKYFNAGGMLLPEPPTDLTVENAGGGTVRVSWAPSPTDGLGLSGHAATGYRVYTSANGVGWSDAVAVSGATQHVLGGLSVGQLLFVRVSATNAGGESFPTETLAVRVGENAEMLLVNGFDRLNRSMLLRDDETIEGPNMRMILDQMNRYDYAIQHGEAILELAFDSASNEAVSSGRINLNNYTVVDWILGEESTTDQTLDATERSLLEAFLAGNGALFISGTEIGYHLDFAGADPSFYNNALHADYAGDDAGTYDVYGVSSPFAGLSFSFYAPGMYDADYPDQLHPIGSLEALRYQGGYGGTAAVQFENGCERVIMFGFPFETIWPPAQRAEVMSRTLSFLDECLSPIVGVDTSIDSPHYASAHNAVPDFSGTAHVQHDTLDGVEVQVQDASSGQFWNGTAWVEVETWVDASGGEAWSYELPVPLPEATYNLRARGRTTGGHRDNTPAEALFIYDITAPAPTSLITPTGGVTVTALPALTLHWADVGQDGGSAISYQVQLDTEVWSATNSSYTMTGVADGVHAWRVQVQDEAGNSSAWTDWATFSISRMRRWLPLALRASGQEEQECSNIIVNGGFETDGAWIVNPEGYAIYSTVRAHSGARSGVVGHDEAEWSSIRQEVVLPAGHSATLRLWLYAISENNDPDDHQYVSVWDKDGNRHSLELTTSDAREWRQGEYDLSDFAGQRVTIIVGAQNDRDGNLTRTYVDDVDLVICP
jgi:N-acetylmuramoyl-L-alanine amidase